MQITAGRREKGEDDRKTVDSSINYSARATRDSCRSRTRCGRLKETGAR